MTDDEAKNKQETLIALARDIQRLHTTTIVMNGAPNLPLVYRHDVLQLITKYFRS